MAARNTKWLSLLLCLALILSMLPTFPAAAATDSFSDYYGRSALATMSNATALLYAYDQLAAGVETCADSITVNNGNKGIAIQELPIVMDAYRRDYAQHFWLGNSYRYSHNGTIVISVLPDYLMTGSTLSSARAAFEAKIDSVLSGITSSMTQQDKALYLHDTLAGMITYTSTSNAHNAYGALVEGQAVCEGYAEAYQVLLHRVGIQSFLAIGDGYSSGSWGGHEWNYVRLNGKYYQTDLTWNDQGERLYHAYYNLNDTLMLEDHRLDSTGYPLPVCNSMDDNYFYGSGAYLTSYTAEIVGGLLKNNGLSVSVFIPGDVSGFITWYRSNISDIITAAGIYGTVSYGYSVSGREVMLRITPSCTHSNLTLHPEAAATCDTDGYKAYYSCSCGGYFEDAAATQRINNLDTWKQGDGRLPAGHVYTIAFGYKDAFGHANTCVCGAVDTIYRHRLDADNCCTLCKWSSKKPVAAVTYKTVTNEFYTMEEAMDACRDRCLLQLLDDVSGTYTFDGMLILDLNGHDLNGTIGGLSISVMDSQTTDYTVNDAAGYGKITGKATHLQPVSGYIKIAGDDGVSFHRVALTLTSVTLRSRVAGMYYNCSFLGDEVVAANVQRYGVAFAIGSQPDATNPGICSWYDSFTAGAAGNQASGALLRGIMKRGHTAAVNEKNAELAVYGRPYLLTNDGTYLFGDSENRSLRQQVEDIDDMWASLTDLQKSELSAMYDTYRSVMLDWDIPNLRTANQ